MDDKVRIDKWLWAARFYKTRALAVEEIHKGRVRVNGVDAKPGREMRVGDTVALRPRSGPVRTVLVLALSNQRGGAPEAQLLYRETEDSMRARADAAEQRRMGVEPALSQPHGRPEKQDRRALQRAWDDRWSASLDD